MRTSVGFTAARLNMAAGAFAVLFAACYTVVSPCRCAAGVVVFGDSLSDTGNLFAVTGGAVFAPAPGSRFPSPPFAAGAASNGKLWVDVLAQRLGEPAAGAAFAGGSNYAFIGAMTGTQVVSPFAVPSMTEQVGFYLASNGGVAATDDLFVVWGGANDFFFGQFDPFISVGNLSNQIQTLAGAGASEFLVPNLIPLDQTPSLLGTPAAAAAAAFSQAFNLALTTEIGMLRSDLDVTIHELNVAGLFSEVKSHPSLFGLTNVVDPALKVELSSSVPEFPFEVVSNPQEYLWWDGVHPSAAGQRIIGNRAAMLVRPVPEPTSLMCWAVLMIGCMPSMRRRMT